MSNASRVHLKTASAPSAAAEQRVREFLAQKKWRKARDEAKPLVKIDRERYQPLLIQANLGLAQQMMSKGQVSEAQQVLSYLATIAPAEQLRALELELAGQGKTDDTTLAKFLAALADPQPELPETERLRLADQLVLTFQPVTGNGPAQETLASGLRAVQESLQAVSQSQWDRLPDLLRAVPHRSPFSHWARFVKGQAAFHTGDGEKARRHFGCLPPDSVPGKASLAYRLLAGERAVLDTHPTETENILTGAGHLTDGAAAGSAVARAETLWKKHRYVESYRALREAVPGFPSRQLNGLGALTEFYFKAPHSMGIEERGPLTKHFDEVLKPRQRRAPVEELLAYRMFALLEDGMGPTYGLRQDWEGFLRTHGALHGARPRLASMVYGHLGERLAERRPHPMSYYARATELRDANGALEALQTSIRLDPNNLPAHLKLCEVYDVLKQTSARNRLLDTMTERFPEDKHVLLLAARRCVDRKAFVKGRGYLERARHLDRLDPAVPELMAVTCRRQARHHYQHRRPDKGRQALAQLEEFLTDQPDDFQRSRWSARARQGLMEQLWGDSKQAESWLAQARAQAPLPEVFLLFTHLAYRVYTRQRSSQSLFLAEFNAKRPAGPTIAGMTLLLQLMDYWKNAPESLYVRPEENALATYLRAALKQPFTRAEAVQVIERAGGNFFFEESLTALVKKVLKRDRRDPQFRLYKLTLGQEWAWDPGNSRHILKSIVEEAARRHDDATAQKARRMLKSLDLPPPMPLEPDDAAEPEDDFEDEFDSADGLEDILPPSIPAGETEELAAILDMLRGASDAEIRRMRKSRPKDIPGYVFDSLVEAAKTVPVPPLPPQPIAPRPSRPVAPQPPQPPPEDPNQLNLF